LGRTDFDFKIKLTDEDICELHEKSPIKHVNKVTTPVQLLVGCMDVRVAPAQSVEYYKALIALGQSPAK
jgi:dipeptidyl aminopeptidase/acylaminoacyl peptidase